MLQQPDPEDYVIASGKTHSVQNLIETAFDCVGLAWNDFVVVDERLYRPAEIEELRGDASKAKRKLGWEPSISFKDLIQMMVDEDLKRLKNKPI
jgi:GDPmannose 4,6-dehydratase